LAEAAAKYLDHLKSSVAGLDAGSRFEEAVAIVAGEKEVFLQQPTNFFFPGLPHRQFYDPAEFSWARDLSDAAPAILAELEAVLASPDGFRPYVQPDPGRANKGHALLNNPDWSAFHLIEGGQPSPGNAERCPVTIDALSKLPMPVIEARSPMALFSVLKPHTHIPPHNGMLNTRLICHLPLIVPHNCRLRVGNETRAVEAGKLIIFDDSILHEAWNDSDDTRIILLFEIWRPELTEAERAALVRLYEAVGFYSGGQ
jgi:aspartyl/asparaginyl beta-hydroxylase (cupin superfamily)